MVLLRLFAWCLYLIVSFPYTLISKVTGDATALVLDYNWMDL